MMLDTVIQSYRDAVIETDREAAFAAVHTALAAGVSAEEVVFRVVIPALEKMMAGITSNPDTNLAQHFMTAQIAADVTDEMLRHFSQPPEIVGRVVIGTPPGDLHSLGKRIVSGCLKALMIEVIDVGVNVPAEQFVAQALKHDAQVIAVSSLMVHTATSPNGPLGIRRILAERGLEQRLRLAVGGAPFRFDYNLYKIVGADAWAADGITAGHVIRRLIGEVKGYDTP